MFVKCEVLRVLLEISSDQSSYIPVIPVRDRDGAIHDPIAQY